MTIASSTGEGPTRRWQYRRMAEGEGALRDKVEIGAEKRELAEELPPSVVVRNGGRFRHLGNPPHRSITILGSASQVVI